MLLCSRVSGLPADKAECGVRPAPTLRVCVGAQWALFPRAAEISGTTGLARQPAESAVCGQESGLCQQAQ